MGLLSFKSAGRATKLDDKPDYYSARDWRESHKFHSPTFTIGSVGNSGDISDDDDYKNRDGKRTRRGRNILNYQGFFGESTDKDNNTQKISSQENEQETTDEGSLQDNEVETSEKELDINSCGNTSQNSKKKHIRDNVIADILGNTIDYSDTTKEILLIYKEQDHDGDLIDLRLNSPFFKNLPKSTARAYLKEMDDITESLVPKNVHDFLVQLFSKNLTSEGWDREVDDLRSSEQNDPIMNAVVRVIRAHLNSFIHPCFDAFLWYIANVHYEYGEITLKRHVNKNRADGAGYLTDANKHQLVYVKDSRLIAKDDKEIADLENITTNLKNMFGKIVKETIKKRRPLPKKIYLFGGQSFLLRIHLFYIDFCGIYRLNEVDNASLPRKFSEMKDFVYFYECILKWALLVRNVTESFDLARTEPRPSRLSFANTLFQLNANERSFDFFLYGVVETPILAILKVRRKQRAINKAKNAQENLASIHSPSADNLDHSITGKDEDQQSANGLLKGAQSSICRKQFYPQDKPVSCKKFGRRRIWRQQLALKSEIADDTLKEQPWLKITMENRIGTNSLSYYVVANSQKYILSQGDDNGEDGKDLRKEAYQEEWYLNIRCSTISCAEVGNNIQHATPMRLRVGLE
ncbi:6101_t:CDS:10 [Diversispora eburnea]|uniref:6101_t:CDS:1 n=1 Tax=Diversispora eburnea TaxID=1213867 RepID=A0A9N8YP64_9GLOM|nr:6101_t:CDS:10 [Diversispora eburnea]